MIKYQLLCHLGHEFEGWFSGSSAYDEQREKHLIECPLCGSVEVKRALSAPNLNSPKLRKSLNEEPEASITTQPAPTPQLDEKQAEAMGMAMNALRHIHKKIQADFTNVGDKFAEEARKIHYGEAKAKPIYGTSTQDERDELADEGIEFYELPDVPQEH